MYLICTDIILEIFVNTYLVSIYVHRSLDVMILVLSYSSDYLSAIDHPGRSISFITWFPILPGIRSGILKGCVPPF